MSVRIDRSLHFLIRHEIIRLNCCYVELTEVGKLTKTSTISCLILEIILIILYHIRFSNLTTGWMTLRVL